MRAIVLCLGLIFAADVRGPDLVRGADLMCSADPTFQGRREPVPIEIATRMRQYSWREGCPTPIAQLSYLHLTHFGYDGGIYQGELVVHQDLADEVLAIFKALFDLRFPIEKIRLIENYAGDDDASMADNNTSGFNCRFVDGKPGIFSKHSFGRAIDLNPRTNPMVTNGLVYPPTGSANVDRNQKVQGMLRGNDRAVREFTRRGWTWGGTWFSMKDYQHFEK